MRDTLNKYFKLDENNTTVTTEAMAGFTTFLAMVYITVLNPSMLSQTGMDFGAVFVATCLAAAIGSLVMGLVGNFPIGLAPGVGQNAIFTYGIVLGMGHPWQTALGAVFISGLIFVLLSITPLREWLVNSIPRNLKLGISAGIGFFLAFIAMRNAGIVADNGATLVSLGAVTDFGPLMALLGFFLIAALASRQVRGAVVIGIFVTAILGWLTGAAEFRGIAAVPPDITPVFLEMDIVAALQLSMVSVVLTLLLVDVFDTAGTLVGVATRGGLINEDGKLPRLRGALFADSSATVAGAALGTSSITSYIESAAGVEAGGRSGLTAIVIGLFFLVCLFFAPLAESVPAYATAAALLFVATTMVSSLAQVQWTDITEAAPAAITAIAMPLAFSIADGIGIGFIAYAAIKALSGRWRETPVAVHVTAVIFALKFALA